MTIVRKSRDLEYIDPIVSCKCDLKLCANYFTRKLCNVKCSVVIMQFPFQTCSVTLTMVGVHSLWNEKFAANNLQTWAAHRAQNKPCIITLIGLAVCINSTSAHSCAHTGWRAKLASQIVPYAAQDVIQAHHLQSSILGGTQTHAKITCSVSNRTHTHSNTTGEEVFWL